MFKQNNKYKIIITIVTIVLMSSLLSIQNGICNAEELPTGSKILKGLVDTGTNSGYSTQSINENTLSTSIAKIIYVVLMWLGIIFLIMVIFSGFQWMTAGGNEETIAKAKKRIINATIGVAIVILSYSITYFIIWIFYGSPTI